MQIRLEPCLNMLEFCAVFSPMLSPKSLSFCPKNRIIPVTRGGFVNVPIWETSTSGNRCGGVAGGGGGAWEFEGIIKIA